jgi:hypothetical protein
MAHVQKPYFVFRQSGLVRLKQWGCRFTQPLAVEVFASVVVMVVMLDTPCSVVVWRVLATHSIRQFPLHFPSCASPYAITFQLDSTCMWKRKLIENTNSFFYTTKIYLTETSASSTLFLFFLWYFYWYLMMALCIRNMLYVWKCHLKKPVNVLWLTFRHRASSI